jgi:hypothetical protein
VANPSGASEPTYNPLQTYVQTGTNIIKVAPGLCGQDSSNVEVAVTNTGVNLATIGLGGSQDIWLGVSIQPVVQPFTVLDGAGDTSTEYLTVGTGNVLSAVIRLSTAVPPAQPSIVDNETGEVLQNAVVYFKLATVTWPGGTAPSVHIYRQGNLDVILIPPNRVYLTAME